MYFSCMGVTVESMAGTNAVRDPQKWLSMRGDDTHLERGFMALQNTLIFPDVEVELFN